jgi:molybdenum cofactor cytidylyltransferase
MIAAMITALVPAAGASRRMGAPKLLLPFGTTTVLGATVAALQAGGCGRVVVVTAPGDDTLRTACVALGCDTAVNPDPTRGMLSSLWAGIEALGTLARGNTHDALTGLAVSPGDLPRLAPATVSAVLGALARGAALAWPRQGARNGHPLAIATAVVPEVFTLDLATGLRALRDRHAGASTVVEVADPGCVEDVDTPADYKALLDAD